MNRMFNAQNGGGTIKEFSIYYNPEGKIDCFFGSLYENAEYTRVPMNTFLGEIARTFDGPLDSQGYYTAGSQLQVFNYFMGKPGEARREMYKGPGGIKVRIKPGSHILIEYDSEWGTVKPYMGGYEYQLYGAIYSGNDGRVIKTLKAYYDGRLEITLMNKGCDPLNITWYTDPGEPNQFGVSKGFHGRDFLSFADPTVPAYVGFSSVSVNDLSEGGSSYETIAYFDIAETNPETQEARCTIYKYKYKSQGSYELDPYNTEPICTIRITGYDTELTADMIKEGYGN